MKVILLLLSLTVAVQAQTRLEQMGFVSREPAPRTPAQQAKDAESEQKLIAKEKSEWLSKDPYRVIGGVTNSVLVDGWMRFSGRVLETHDEGIRVEGVMWRWTNQMQKDFKGEFFVRNFPASVSDDAKLSWRSVYVAKQVEHYSYKTVTGATHKIVCLDYGTPCDPAPPPKPTDEQIAAARQKVEDRNTAQASAILKYHQGLAAGGDAYGQLRMGERYRNGDGVEKNETVAREYLEKSSAQGNADATRALQNLSSEKVAR